MKEGYEFLYLSKQDVARLSLSMTELSKITDHCLSAKYQGKTQNPPKVAVHINPYDVGTAAPAWVTENDFFAMDWSFSFAGNTANGIPYHNGLLILNRGETGMALAVMDSSAITAHCLGALAGVEAACFAKLDSRILGILGCGVEAATHTQALMQSCPQLKALYLFDRDHAAAARFAAQARDQYHVETVVCTEAETAIRNADILLSATTWQKTAAQDALIQADMLKKGVLVITLDWDQQFASGVIDNEISCVIADDKTQYQAMKQGFMREDPQNVSDLAEIYGKGECHRATDKDSVLCINSGLKLAESIVAYDIYTQALAQNIGYVLPL